MELDDATSPAVSGALCECEPEVPGETATERGESYQGTLSGEETEVGKAGPAWERRAGVLMPRACKLVPEERRRRSASQWQPAHKHLVLMTLTVRGLRQHHKVEARKRKLRDLAVDVAIITVSRLSRKETKRLVLPKNTIEAMECQEDEAHRGVFIAVKPTVRHSKEGKPEKIRQPTNACTLYIHPTERDDLEIR